MRCVACGASSTRLDLRLERSVLAVCAVCGHGTTVHAPRSVVAADYGLRTGARDAYERDYLAARMRSWEAGLELLGVDPGARLLDYGANYGHFIELARRRGADAWGLEPGSALRENAVVSARSRLVGSLEQAAALGPFAAVTLWDVLEHLHDPAAALATVAGLLQPGGAVLVRVPDARVLSALRSRRLWRLVGPAYLKLCHPVNADEHPSHFTPESLAHIARSAGLHPHATMTAAAAERVSAGRTRADAAVRAALHRLGRALPYEFTTLLRRLPA
jgi:2-polyprenyl-3-methyl-5-hydroxy-6-metoxy-1,4-benzoquinol methylase